ncbi:MAG: RDD family protein, partial [Caulobacteraceae bacterium]
MARAQAVRKERAKPRTRASAVDADLRSLVTPEGVDLRLRLAEVGQRLSALILDELIMGAVFVGCTIAGLIGLAALHNLAGAETLLVAWLLAGFLLRNFYFIAFELSARAATPGKRRCGLRVTARNGGRLTAD